MELQLLASRPHVTGSRAVLKAVEKGQAKAVFIALDAEKRVIQPLKDACGQHGVAVIEVAAMKDIGRAARLDVPAAAVALLKL